MTPEERIAELERAIAKHRDACYSVSGDHHRYDSIDEELYSVIPCKYCGCRPCVCYRIADVLEARRMEKALRALLTKIKGPR